MRTDNNLENNNSYNNDAEFNKEIIPPIKETDKENDEDNNSNDYYEILNKGEEIFIRENKLDMKKIISKNQMSEEFEYKGIYITLTSKFDNLNLSKINIETRTRASTTNKTSRENLPNLKIFTYPKENYDGEIDENYVRNGYGIYEYHNGDIYEGEFENGTRNGEGEYNYFDGSIYRGHWVNDRKHGIGTFKFDKYEVDGEWFNDVLKEGFTFKINQFYNCNSSFSGADNYSNCSLSNNEEVFEHSTSSNESDKSLNLEYDKIEDINYLRNYINHRYRLLHRQKFKIDIELLNFKSSATKQNLINELLRNTVINNKYIEINNNENHHENCPYLNFILTNSYLDLTYDKSNFNCNCYKFGKNFLTERNFTTDEPNKIDEY